MNRQCLMCIQLLTRVSPGTEGTLSTPSDAVQAAALSVCSSTSLEGLRAHVVPFQTLPANIHVYIVISLQRFWVKEWGGIHKEIEKHKNKLKMQLTYISFCDSEKKSERNQTVHYNCPLQWKLHVCNSNELTDSHISLQTIKFSVLINWFP